MELKEWRMNLGISQEEAAKMLNVSRPYVTQIENGKRRITPRILKRMGRYTSVLKPMENDISPDDNLFIINGGMLQKESSYEHLSDAVDSRDWEKWWWKRKHPLCLRCVKTCKQSSKVKIIQCPQYEAKE